MTQHQSHARRWIILLVVVAIVAAGAVLSAVLGNAGSPVGKPTASPRPSATTPAVKPVVKPQRTLLIQVRDDDRRVIYSGLIATSFGKTYGARMQLPAGLLVPIPTWVPLRLTGDANDTLQSQHAIEELLGVDVDISLVFDRLALSGLYDATLVPLFAQEAKASSDINQWIIKALINMPPKAADAGQVVLSLGHMARSSASNIDLVDLILAIRSDARAKKLTNVILPTDQVRATGTAVAIPSATNAVMRQYFSRTLLAPGQAASPRIVLTPAGASATQLATATSALIEAGMTVIPGEPMTARKASAIQIPDSTVSSTIGTKVATVLGIFPQEVRRVKGYIVDAEVLLGSDAAQL
jgi:hypothetical protein